MIDKISKAKKPSHSKLSITLRTQIPSLCYKAFKYLVHAVLTLYHTKQVKEMVCVCVCVYVCVCVGVFACMCMSVRACVCGKEKKLNRDLMHTNVRR